MVDIVKIILSNILTALYQPFWFSVILSVFFMFIWKNYHSVKEAAIQWIRWFKSEQQFRRMFLLTFYTVMILFRTLLNRSMWANPVSNVIGVWGLYRFDSTKNEMVLTTEAPENLVLFIPFTILLLWIYRKQLIGEEVKLSRVLIQGTKIVFIFSFIIEFLQLFLRLGNWQLSDLFYNTLGGVIGGLVYWIGYRMHSKK